MPHCQQHTISFYFIRHSFATGIQLGQSNGHELSRRYCRCSWPLVWSTLPARKCFLHSWCGTSICRCRVAGYAQREQKYVREIFAAIAASRDWCSYWEIDKWNRPAPVDYQNDSAFGITLNANFELLYTAERFYRWTGDTYYIHHPGILHFFEKTLHEYIKAWKLQPWFITLPVIHFLINVLTTRCIIIIPVTGHTFLCWICRWSSHVSWPGRQRSA